MSERPDVYLTARRGPLTRLAGRLSARFRRRRYMTFVRALRLSERDRILDVGCGPVGLGAFDEGHQIVGLDQEERPTYPAPGRHFVRGDALAMPFGDGDFDAAYCNSVIEHVDPSSRPRLAGEIRRVARRYFVQTPNRYFPIEPHVLLPLFQFLPRSWQRRLWRFGASKDAYHEIHLLDRRELARLFPDAVILRERFGPFTKSLIAVGPREKVSV